MKVCFHLKITLLIFNFALLFWTTSACGQNLLTQTGLIALPNRPPIGSGFVFGKQRDVVTCWHVLEDARTNAHETNLFFVNSNRTYALTVKRELTNYDLVTFSTTPQIDGEPLPAGDIKKIMPEDSVFYVGFDKTASLTKPTIVFRESKVEWRGIMDVMGIKTEALCFAGVGSRGYSGGAVFTTNFEIVALIKAGGAMPTELVGRKGALIYAITIAPLLDAETNNPHLPLKPSAPPRK